MDLSSENTLRPPMIERSWGGSSFGTSVGGEKLRSEYGVLKQPSVKANNNAQLKRGLTDEMKQPVRPDLDLENSTSLSLPGGILPLRYASPILSYR